MTGNQAQLVSRRKKPRLVVFPQRKLFLTTAQMRGRHTFSSVSRTLEGMAGQTQRNPTAFVDERAFAQLPIVLAWLCDPAPSNRD
ncbi:MAG: hypothetical protein ACRENP_29050 [Longimicrobiales bacterium]